MKTIEVKSAPKSIFTKNEGMLVRWNNGSMSAKIDDKNDAKMMNFPLIFNTFSVVLNMRVSKSRFSISTYSTTISITPPFEMFLCGYEV